MALRGAEASPSFDASLDAELLRSVFTDGDVTFAFAAGWDGKSRAYADEVGAHASPFVESTSTDVLAGRSQGPCR